MAKDYKKLAMFVGGTLFGSAGIKILSSKDAKKLYTNVTAAVLRMKDCVMKTVTTVQENAGDILSDAKEINENRAAAAETVEDTSEEACGCEKTEAQECACGCEGKEA